MALFSMGHGTNVYDADKKICNKFVTYQCLAGKLSSYETFIARLTERTSDQSSLDDGSIYALKV